MLLFLYISAIKSAYYIEVGFDSKKYKCDTRDDLIDRINSMDLSYQRLPTITIDEDLELDCNELPMFYYKIATLHRVNNFPTYTFQSNKTDGFATFSLDTSTDSEDNCPGFTFTNLNVIFKGSSLNTSKISINNNVLITSDPKFELHTTVSEIPLNYLPVFPNLSFCQLTILPESFSLLSENFSYPSQIELALDLKYAEAYMFYLDIDQNTDVLYENNIMIIDIENKTTINVYLPEIINYSNAFYFNIVSSNISFTISGDLNYTDQFPHYLYILQDPYISENINVTLNPGNYFSSLGTRFNTVHGEPFSLSLVLANLFWNNNNPITSVALSFVNLHLNDNFQIASSDIFKSSFLFYGQTPINGNLSIICDLLAIPYHLEPAEGCVINISASQISSDSVDFNGTLYVTELINQDVNVEHLHFVNNPLISLRNRYTINAKTVTGKAKISPYTFGSIGTITPVICSENAESINLDDFTIESEYSDAFQPVISDGCLCVNKTKQNSLNLAVTIQSEDGDEWQKKYESFHRTITFTISTEHCSIDLTILSNRTQPVNLIFQASIECSIEIIITQKVADLIERLQIGNSEETMKVTWSDTFNFNGDLILYKCCPLFEVLDRINLEKTKSVTLKDFSQLSEIEPFSSHIDTIILATTAKVKNVTFTSQGWRYHTDDMDDDEEREIRGFNHTNILLPITSSNAYGTFFSRLINIGLETLNPYRLYISFDMSITVNLADSDAWEEIDFQPLILVAGTITLNMESEVLPVNFNDNKFERNLNRMGTRSLVVNRSVERIQSILSVNSIFNLQYNFAISNFDRNSNLYIEINNEAVINGSNSISHSDKVFIVFRDKLIMDNAALSRMWRESNSILMVNFSSLISPSFLDDIKIIWDFANETARMKPSMIENALSTSTFSFEFANVSHINISEVSEMFFNQPFQIANALIDIDCEELLSKVIFVDNKMSFNFSNKVVSFELICTDLIYSTYPITFTQNGYQQSEFPSHIALFLNKTTILDDDGIKKSKGKHDLDPGVIACIIIAVITVIIIIICLTIYFFNRRKHSIENLVDS